MRQVGKRKGKFLPLCGKVLKIKGKVLLGKEKGFLADLGPN